MISYWVVQHCFEFRPVYTHVHATYVTTSNSTDLRKIKNAIFYFIPSLYTLSMKPIKTFVHPCD